jgi:hypothetical protein
MPFFPDTPITIFYAVALVVAIALASRGGWAAVPVIAVMAFNWIGTRTITATDAPAWTAGALDLSSAFALIVAWWQMRAMAVLPVAACFLLMVLSYLLNDLGFIGRETMWAFADVGAYLQLVIMAGTPWGAGPARRLAAVVTRGGRTPAVVRVDPRRVPHS